MSQKKVLWSVFGTALAIRMAAFLSCQNSMLFNHPFGDAKWFDQWAMGIASGQWLGKGVFYLEPLYPYVLGLLYAVIGHSIMAVRFFQHMLGAGSCVLIALIGSRIFSRRAGLLAGLIASAYGLLIFYEAQLLKETLAVFLLCALTLALLEAKERREWSW